MALKIFAGDFKSRSANPNDYDTCEQFDRIDWVAATPSWSSIVVGVILPVLAIVALTLTIDAVLVLAFERWMGHFLAIPLWLVMTVAFPLALIGTVAVTKLLIKIFNCGAGAIPSQRKLFD